MITMAQLEAKTRDADLEDGKDEKQTQKQDQGPAQYFSPVFPHGSLQASPAHGPAMVRNLFLKKP